MDGYFREESTTENKMESRVPTRYKKYWTIDSVMCPLAGWLGIVSEGF